MFTKSILFALLGSASLVALTTGAQAADDVPQVKVSYSDLDLQNPTDTKRLYSRLRVAANHVCKSFDGRDLTQAALKKACVQEALDRAVVDVNDAAVLALHSQQGDTRIAQKTVAQQPRG